MPASAGNCGASFVTALGPHSPFNSPLCKVLSNDMHLGSPGRETELSPPLQNLHREDDREASKWRAAESLCQGPRAWY